MFLGVNIDHIAVLREARKINDPDPLEALGILKRSGADQITIHLREDRRHIHDDDAYAIIQHASLPVNLECAIDEAMIEKAISLCPHRVTLVPEKREEVTTEGGLDVVRYFSSLQHSIAKFKEAHIEVSLFIDPCAEMIEASHGLGVQWIELHTGEYANVYAMLYSNLARTHHAIESLRLDRQSLHVKLEGAFLSLMEAAQKADQLGLKVAAGHGLNYHNVTKITTIPEIVELNIGQSIIARSVFTGLENAVKEMVELLR